jgi:hypothetical protein
VTSIRTLVAALAVICVFVPRVATGQTSTGVPPPQGAEREQRHRLSVQLAGGPTLTGGGNVLSAAFAYLPASRLELLVNIERTHLPFRLQRAPDGDSATRGGTMTFVSGELRLALLPAERVSPFAVAGVGGGVSRPTVNAEFPDRVSNGLRVLYLGGGVRIPLRRGFSLLGDARAMLALEGNDGVLAVWPIRAGVAWRF